MANSRSTEKFRDDNYRDNYQTKIFQEIPSSDNPYCESEVYCHGYNQFELINNLRFPEYLFLLLRGRLPEENEVDLLNKMLIAFSNPGVRHPATRAAISAGVGRTLPENVLPAALMILNGKESGIGSLEPAMKFIRSAVKREPSSIFEDIEKNIVFGLYHGSEYVFLNRINSFFLHEEQWPHLQMGMRFINYSKNKGELIGWHWHGLAAAALCDLDIPANIAPGLMQIICAPGLLVQGMECARQSPTVLPFVTDENYEIEN